MHKRGFLLVTSLLVLLLAGAPDSTASAPVKAVPQKGKFAAGINGYARSSPARRWMRFVPISIRSVMVQRQWTGRQLSSRTV